MTTGFIYLGIAVLSIWVGLAARRDQADSREWKQLLLVPFAAVGGLVAVFWGIFGWHPPLFMFPKWYRPLKAEDRERRRRERLG